MTAPSSAANSHPNADHTTKTMLGSILIATKGSNRQCRTSAANLHQPASLYCSWRTESCMNPGTSRLAERLSSLGPAALHQMLGSHLSVIFYNLGLGKNAALLAQTLLDVHGSTFFRERDFRVRIPAMLTPDEVSLLRGKLGMKEGQAGSLNERLRRMQWKDSPACRVIAGLLGFELSEFLPDSIVDATPALLDVLPEVNAAKLIEDDSTRGLHVFPMHPYQKDVKDQMVQHGWLRDSWTGSMLVRMPTGAGKTKTAAEAMCDFLRTRAFTGSLLWIVHTKELCDQAANTFASHWKVRGDRPITIARLYGDKHPDCPQNEPDVVFIGFQKLVAAMKSDRRTASWLREYARLVVVDEAHKILAPTYRRAVEFLRGTEDGAQSFVPLLGLTATTGRGTSETENAEFAAYFDNEVIRIRTAEDVDELQMLRDGGYLARLKRIVVNSDVILSLDEGEWVSKANDDVSEAARKVLSADAQRTRLIVGQIIDAVLHRKDKTLVFATSVAHCTALRFLLAREGIKAECVFGHTPGPKRAEVIERFKAGDLMVLINFEVLTTGFDAPRLETLVIARPTNSPVLYSQMVGRALRGPQMGGNSLQNTLVDLVDNNGRFGNERAAFHYFDGYFDA